MGQAPKHCSQRSWLVTPTAQPEEDTTGQEPFPNGLAQQHIPPDAQGYDLLSALIVALPMGS